MRKVLAIFVLGIFLASSAFGAVAVKEDGVYVGEAVSIDLRQMPQSSAISKSGSDIRVDFNYGAGKVTVLADTPDTLTTTQGGTTFILTNPDTGGRKIGLPKITSANDGLWYTIVKGGAVTGKPHISDDIALLVQPQDGDVFHYGNAKLAATKGLKAGVAQTDSYPTLKVVVMNGAWYVESVKGTFASN
jgi:hypothetical protein